MGSDADEWIMVKDNPVYGVGLNVVPNVSPTNDMVLVYALPYTHYGFYIHFNVTLEPSENRTLAFGYDSTTYKAIGKNKK